MKRVPVMMESTEFVDGEYRHRFEIPGSATTISSVLHKKPTDQMRKRARELLLKYLNRNQKKRRE